VSFSEAQFEIHAHVLLRKHFQGILAQSQGAVIQRQEQTLQVHLRMGL
jgi:hypothetical protein